MKVEWSELKSFVDGKKLSIQILKENSDGYRLLAFDGVKSLECSVQKTNPKNSEQTEFESRYLSNTNKADGALVTTQYEKNDKILRCVCALVETDVNGEAEFCIPVPSDGRWIAYGDVEFENRTFGDYVKTIEISDLDRILALMVAQGIDPNAVNPVDDATAAAALGFPLYPVLGHYDERHLPNPLPANAKGNPKGGMGMSFQYGITEAEPIGGYGKLEGLMYLRVVAKKASAVQGVKCQLSIDWAAPSG